MAKRKTKASTIKFERERMVDVTDLKLDRNNNRVSHLKIKNDQELEEILWKEGELQTLFHDIMNRGLQEPLVLYPNSTIVAEGNCRLACLKKLQREAIESNEPLLEKFKKLPVLCKRISKDTPTADIDAYLTEIHVGRKKKWPEYNQAKLLYKLKVTDGLPLEEIAYIARSSRPTISKKINCYTYTKKYHVEFPRDEDYDKKFYWFWEFQHVELDDFRKKESNVKKFMKWVFYGKFPTSKHVRDLPKVMKNPKAFSKFEISDMEEAVNSMLDIDPTIRSPFYRNIHKLTLKLKNYSTKEFTDLVGNESKKKMILQLKNSADELLKYIHEMERKRN